MADTTKAESPRADTVAWHRRHRNTSALLRIAKWSGLLACILTLIAWGLSTRRVWCYTYKGTQIILAIGRISWVHGLSLSHTQNIQGLTTQAQSLKHVPTFGRRMYGFTTEFRRNPGARGVGAPLWFLVILAVAPSAFAGYFDRRRFPPGCCLTCGYDLTGNVTGRCSECGTQIPLELRPKASVL